MYYVYLSVNDKGGKYIGYTSDLKKRVTEHNSGANPSTKGHVWKLAYYEGYLSESDARRGERSLKKSSQARLWMYERASESLCS